VNAIVPFWELSKLPPQWVEVMRLLDVVLAPTLFVRDLARSADLGDVEIVHFPQTCELPHGVSPDRTRWGFSDADVIFVGSFDLSSDLSRKNPAGTVAAFRAMRAATDATTAQRAGLVLKVNNPKGDRFQAGRLEELTSLCAHDPAITIIAESLPYADVLSLYASSDVFVSLHRAEGLGLGLLEAMMLGVPVIATAYSGNLDFMTPSDSRLVPYTLVPVAGTSIGSYDPRYTGAGQLWAEPDIHDAARGMLELMDDAHRAQLSAAAQAAAVSTRDNPQRRGAIERVLELAETPRATSQLGELQRLPAWYWRARGLAGAGLRSVGLRP
jgi:glycosyltransferase involved in cell wall biosynthesis